MIIAIKNNLYILKTIFKASPSRILMTSVYNLWVTFVQVAFMNLLPRYLINAYETQQPYEALLLVLFVLWISQIGYTVFSNYYNSIYKPVSDEKIFQYIQKRIFLRSISISMVDMDDPQYYSDFTKASNEAKDRAISSLDQLIQTISSVIAIVVLLFVVIEINAAFLIIVFLPIFISIIFGKTMDRLIFSSDMEVVESERKVNYVNRVFFLRQYSKEIKTSNIKSFLLQQVTDAVNDIKSVRKRYGKKIGFIKAIIVLINDVICYFGAISFALFLLINTAIKISDFVFVITSLNSLSQRIQNCMNNFFKIYNSKSYIDNIRRFIAKDSEVESHKQVYDDLSFSSIEFKDVSFKYKSSNQYVLKNLSLKIEAEKRIAIIGYNGAGKTTFIKLLMRLYDVGSGEILLNGSPVNQVDMKQYRSLFSCIFQDYALFGCTVGENVLCKAITEKDHQVIIHALKMSGLYKDMQKNGIKIDTMVTKEFDDSGVIFSGGQLQKLAIARAFANKRQVVILDEPSSALDPIAEYEMFESFKDVYMNKTLIYITHRIASSILADTIYFFENGEIVEAGSHHELMQLNKKYAQLYNLQSKQYSDVENKELKS